MRCESGDTDVLFCFVDDTKESHEDRNDRNIILGAWVTMLTFLSQDCTKRIHNLKIGINDSFKLMVKIINSCLEEVVALARLVCEIKALGEDKYINMLHHSVYKHRVKILFVMWTCRLVLFIFPLGTASKITRP